MDLGLRENGVGERPVRAVSAVVLALVIVAVVVSVSFGWVGSPGGEGVNGPEAGTESGALATAEGTDTGGDGATTRETVHIAGNQQFCRYQVPERQEPDYTVSPEDGSSGLQEAIDSAGPGDLIYLEGGTYEMDSKLSIDGDGSEGNRITLAGKPGERPVLDYSQLSAPNSSDPEFDFGSAVEVDGDYWTIRNIEVKGSPGFGIRARGGENHLVFENVEAHNNALTGLALIESSHNEIRHSSFHHNYDARNAGEHADGVGIKQGPDPEGKTANENLLYCTDMYLNSDDGFDAYRSNDNDIFYNRAWENGKINETELAESGNGNGFKFGPYNAGGHLVVGNLAWSNERKEEGEHAKATGFDYNGAEKPIILYHNTAWDNDMGFNFQNEGAVLINNLAVGNEIESNLWTSYPEEFNVFTTAEDRITFRSTDPEDPDFLMPVSGSEAIDAGQSIESVDWAIAGTGPDIGAVEFRNETARAAENRNAASDIESANGDTS
ncbi:right-handed parallel beta-helix repeat-containing protein [Haloarcula sp. 1CSR25-25]|uniref:right-handed parallel beta-helix repeat-containing protein n=1 Tax=Haloarcula sp. 1CSR25-25 TaxID=2862545 RepID=UPI00289FF09C|nr:right-handed parallel beta-helix repeat-containing protein [Haloarcula sp. 1CSR25-25]